MNRHDRRRAEARARTNRNHSIGGQQQLASFAQSDVNMDELSEVSRNFEALYNMLPFELKQCIVKDVNDAIKDLGLMNGKGQGCSAALHRMLATEPHKFALKIYEVLDSWVATLSPLPEFKQAVACQSGCSACCHIVPEVSRGEKWLIANYIHHNLSTDQQAAIAAQTKKAAEQVRAHGGSAHASWPLRCPLLTDDGICSVYPARPSACRAWMSSDKNQCDGSLAAAQTGNLSPTAPRVPIPFFGAVLMCSRAIFSGYCALAEAEAAYDVKALPLALEEFFEERAKAEARAEDEP